MSIFENDTIAAISTPYGKGGVAVIRISGESAFSVADKIFKSKKISSVSELPSHTAVYGDVVSPKDLCVIDDVLLTVFKSPRSYTGEDTVEISCHGGILITSAVLDAALAAGARAASAGEFTRRAFLGGKLTLSSAEAISDMLEATNTEQLKISRASMRGALTKKTDSIYESLGDVLSNVFACIDFPDEDLSFMSSEEMTDALVALNEKIDALSATYKTGHAILEGIPCVICGKTNVGKSSLYNMLLGRTAAIVTDIEGTTRDVLSEKITLGRVTLRLSDTAGIRDSSDKVEQIGIARARDEMSNAELIFAVFDATREISEDDISLIESLKTHRAERVAILNKCDGERKFDASILHESFDNVIEISALGLVGRDEICSALEALFIDGRLNIGEDALITNARQNAALTNAKEAISRAIDSIRCKMPLDACCIDIEEAMQYIGEIDGKSTSEDVVAKIFSKFCVGK
jgi:tRNA modification GTPase